MIYDILEVFRYKYSEVGDKLILDTYTLKEGLYIKINKNESLEYFIVKRKNRELNFSDIDANLNYEAFEWFKGRDYYSNYLNSNKAIDPPKKVIHNNNYLTLFMKVDNFNVNNLEYIKEKLFDVLSDFKSFNKSQEKNILKQYKEYIESRKDDVFKKYEILKDKFKEIEAIAKENEIKNYVKIFFDEEIDKYKKESEIYYSIKIFNDIKYSQIINELIYGLSNSNMGLNAKKPFLENKTKKLSTPFMITNEEAIDIKKFFDWLKYQDYKFDYPFKDALFIKKHSKNDEAEIIDFDFISTKIDKFEKSIIIKNYLLLKEKKVLKEDKEVEYISQLEKYVDEILYNEQLIYNYFGEVYKKLDNSFANLIYITREAMINFFKKYDDRAFYQVIKKYTNHLAIEHIKKDRFFRAGLSLNLKLSLLEYKGEEIMDIKNIQKEIIDKLMDSNYDKLSKDEFFYLSGQVAKFLITKSEKHDKKGDMFEPYLRANNSQKLKRVIETEYFKYKHAIPIGYVKFNNAMSLIMAYDENEKLSLSNNMDNFLVGALSDNIFYMPKEDKK